MMCPISPALPEVPRTTSSLRTIPQPIPVPMYMKTKLPLAAGAAGPGFGHGGAGDVLVHERGQAGGLGQGIAQPHAVPARQQRRVHDGALVEVDGPRRRNPQPGDPGRVHPGVRDELLDFGGDGVDDGPGVAAGRGLDPGVPDDGAHQVQHHERGHGRVQVDAHGVHAGGVEPEHGPRLARPGAFLAGLDDQVLVQQAAGDVGDRLRGQPDDLGQFHPAEAARGAPDGIKDDSEVEVAHPGQVGSAPRRGLADLGH